MPIARAHAPANFQWRHMPGLDGLRGVAILLVLVHHLFLNRTFGIEGRLDSFVRSGWMGVDLFFVLSGFLITGILLDTKCATRRFTNFYARRTLRIFPLYFATLFVVLVAVPAVVAQLNVQSSGVSKVVDSIHEIEQKQIYLWTYMTNIVGGDWAMFNHCWSLAVEEQFYIFWPFVILLCAPRQSMAVCAALILFAPALRIATLHYEIPYVSPNMFLFCRADSLAMGSLAALVARERGPAALIPFGKAVSIAFLVALAALVIVYGGIKHHCHFTSSIGYSLLSLGFTGTVIVCAAASPTSWLGWAILNPAMMGMGKYSYCAYIVHRLLTRPLMVILPPATLIRWTGSPLAATMAFFLIATALTFIVAYFSWHLFERHFLSLKRYFDSRKEPVVEPAPNAAVIVTT